MEERDAIGSIDRINDMYDTKDQLAVLNEYLLGKTEELLRGFLRLKRPTTFY